MEIIHSTNYFQEAKSKYCTYKQDGELAKFLARELTGLREAATKQRCKWIEAVEKVKGDFSFKKLGREGLGYFM